MHTIRTLLCVCLLALPPAADNTVKRGRNEGTATIPASNVMGNGNITLSLDLGGAISSEALRAPAVLGGQIGIGGIMQLKASASLIDYQELGPAEAHLQITTPANDKLRFFGFALSGDLYLSTSPDVLSFSADSTRPFYSPFLLPTSCCALSTIPSFSTATISSP
jgi:hypothetical protein